MFSSLRSRLWLTYALLIAAALTVVAAVLFGYLISNPLVYRQTAQRISQVQQVLLNRQQEWLSLSPAQLQRRLDRTNETLALEDVPVRVLVFDRQRSLTFDSQPAAPNLRLPRAARARAQGILRDAGGAPWLYTLAPLENGGWLLVSAPRPDVPLAAIFRDEFFAPILRAGIVALLLSLVLAYAVARWVADPLQRLVAASRQVASARQASLPPADLPGGGPREVQELVQAYNDMLARLASSQKSQRDFVANVSHEMKTPLTSIQGFAQAILDGTAAQPAEQQQAAGIIYQEAGRMHRMVSGLLDLARLDAGTANFQFQLVDLGGLLTAVGETFAPQARQRGVTLRVDAPALPTLRGDGDRLAQVLGNLLDNALRHTPPGGQVTLAARAEPSAVCVTVSDSGEGISPQHLPHIFERFYRADRARQGGSDHGAGLGLAIAQEIAASHGGTLSVESQLGQGSTFTLRLPAKG